MRVDVRSGDDLAILCADVVHFPFEITHPEIASHVSDHDVDRAVDAPRALAADCADEGALLVTTHSPRSGGRPGAPRRGQRFAFDPGWPRR